MKQILCLAHAPWRARPDRTQQLLTRLGDAQILFFEPAPRKGEPMPEQGRRVRAHITVYTLPSGGAARPGGRGVGGGGGGRGGACGRERRGRGRG
ncbi:MAG: hypothetical protein K2M42_09080, partial [Oscillospiraceae bacterium]|nr:hypothetical protein [Oscillospiraceae bacterium]